MKQAILAATAAALFILSACSPSTLPADVAAEPAKPEAGASATQTVPEDVATLPAEDDAQPVVDGWFDEPEKHQRDIDEVVTYTLRIPHLTLASDAASETINDGMAQLLSALETYAEDDIYTTALEKQAMAFVDGDYTISMTPGRLTLTYTLTVRYGADGTAETTVNTYVFDAATGERIAE